MQPYYLVALGVVGVSAWGPGWGWGGPGSDNDGDGGPFGSSSGSSSPSSSSSSSSSGPFGAGNSNFQTAAGFDYEQAVSYGHVHGILAAVAFVGFFPIGAILMRAVPGRFAWVIHALAQILGYLVFVAAAVLGLLLVRMVRLPGSGESLLESAQTKAHPIIGLVVLAVLFFQPLLGWLHHRRFKRLGRRTGWSHAHLWTGRSMILLGIVNGGLGLQLSRASDSKVIAYAVTASLICLLWAILAVVSEYRRRRSAQKTARSAPSPVYNDPSPPYSRHHLHATDVEMTAAKRGRRASSSISSLSSSQSQRPIRH